MHPPTRRRVVLVAGSGRSGTSTISGILKELGVRVPQPEVEPDDTNPKGFAEPQWVVDFHDRLLKEAGVRVSDARPQAWSQTGKVELREEARAELEAWLESQFDEADELVIKDPRLAWFLGLWRATATRVGAEASIVTMLRPPTEVIGSTRTYYGRRGEIDVLAAWVNMMLHTERATRGAPRAFVRYHDLLDDWTIPVLGLGERFGLASVTGAGPAQMSRVHEFVDPNLRRIAVDWDDMAIPAPLREIADGAWEHLSSLAEPDGDVEAVRAGLDELLQRFTAYYEEAEAVANSSVLAARRQGIHKREELARRNAALRERLQKELEAQPSAGHRVRGRRARSQGRSDEGGRRGGGLAGAEPASLYDSLNRAVPSRLRRLVPGVWRARLRRLAEQRGSRAARR